MTRKEAVNILKCVEAHGSLVKEDKEKAIEALEQEPKWIPVSERLPEKYGQYLVTFIPSAGTLWTHVLIARYSDLMGIAKPSFHIGNVGKNDFANITEQVTAWMPLPEPYVPKINVGKRAESEDKDADSN